MGDKFEISFARETGLLAVSLDGQLVELCLEDLDEIQQARELIGDDKIANREDFK
jgi:hypothetical protein